MSIQEYTSAATNRPTAAPHGPRQSATTLKLLKQLRLTYITTADLTLQRQRRGRGFRYLTAEGKPVGAAEAKRLASLAVPPAYVDVLYAADPRAHIQAIGRDAAGRLQYRYHPDWQRVRETRKARRLARLAEALPQIRRSIGQYLSAATPSRAFTLAAIIDLSRELRSVRVPSNMPGCARRAARRRCLSRTFRSTAKRSSCGLRPRAAS